MVNKLRKKQQKRGQMKVLKKREKTIGKQLKSFGKVGGLIDRRNRLISSDNDDVLKRSITEKIRQMNTLSRNFLSIDENQLDTDDLLLQAAKRSETARYDAVELDEDENLDESFVNDLNFSNEKISFKDVMSKKIAEMKLTKLKRLEENEEQRSRNRVADEEWSDRIRFQLEKFAQFKSKNSIDAALLEEKSVEVTKLMKLLDSKRSVAPIDSSISKSVSKITEMLNMNVEDVTLTENSPILSLRILSESEEHANGVIAFLTSRLTSFPNFVLLDNELDSRPKNPCVMKAITHCTALLYAELIGNHFQKHSLFSAELPNFLLRLFKELLILAENSNFLDVELDELQLDQAWLSSDCKYNTDFLNNKILWKTICLLEQSLDHCSSINAPNVSVQIFSQFVHLSSQFAKTCKVPMFSRKFEQIVAKIEQLSKEKCSKRLKYADKLNMVLSNESRIKSKEVIKLGLVPQLEPRFDENFGKRARFTAGRDTANVKKKLVNRLKKEKRNAMRELRKDSIYMSTQELNKTKANDAFREKMTKNIIASMRSVQCSKRDFK